MDQGPRIQGLCYRSANLAQRNFLVARKPTAHSIDAGAAINNSDWRRIERVCLSRHSTHSHA